MIVEITVRLLRITSVIRVAVASMSPFNYIP